jgi:hypothetical protein
MGPPTCSPILIAQSATVKEPGFSLASLNRKTFRLGGASVSEYPLAAYESKDDLARGTCRAILIAQSATVKEPGFSLASLNRKTFRLGGASVSEYPLAAYESKDDLVRGTCRPIPIAQSATVKEPGFSLASRPPLKTGPSGPDAPCLVRSPLPLLSFPVRRSPSANRHPRARTLHPDPMVTLETVWQTGLTFPNVEKSTSFGQPALKSLP